MELWRLFKTSILLAAISLVLSACGGGSGNGGYVNGGGGGGGGATVSGVAAAGAPILGKACMKDSSNPVNLQCVDIALDGKFSFDVSGSKYRAPFVLQAEGTAGDQYFKLYSMASGSGIANINPISNLAVATVTGKDPGTVFTDPVANTISATIRDAAITDAINKIKTLLQPLLALQNAATPDPLRAPFTANNKGLDGVFDLVKIKVTIANGIPQLSIDSKISGAHLLPATSVATATANAGSTAAALQTAVAKAGSALSDAVTDLAAISAQLQAVAAELNSKGANANIEPFFATTNFGISSGLNRADYISTFKNFAKQVTGLSPLTIVGKNGNDYNIRFLIYFADGSWSPQGHLCTKENGVWKVKGNGYKSSISIHPTSYKWASSSSTTYASGIDFTIRDPGTSGLATAIVTGPGLPAGGITFSKQSSQDSTLLILDSAFVSSAAKSSQLTFREITDSDISAALSGDGPFLYTVTLYKSDKTIAETRIISISKGPETKAAISADTAWLPAITSLTSHLLTTITAGTSLSYNYSLPAKYKPRWLDSWLMIWKGSSSTNYYKTLNLDNTAETISYSPVGATSGEMSILAYDQYNRCFHSVWFFN